LAVFKLLLSCSGGIVRSRRQPTGSGDPVGAGIVEPRGRMYSELVMEHFMNPRNVGVIEDADGVGKEGNPVCGDLMEIFIKVEDNRIDDIKFKTFGCGAAIATSSMVTEMVKGKTLDEALEVSNKAVAEALGGLPPIKMHCSNLAADALHKAIEDYRARQGSGDD
jgi:nitrogen fixation NifU-like protein